MLAHLCRIIMPLLILESHDEVEIRIRDRKVDPKV